MKIEETIILKRFKGNSVLSFHRGLGLLLNYNDEIWASLNYTDKIESQRIKISLF